MEEDPLVASLQDGKGSEWDMGRKNEECGKGGGWGREGDKDCRKHPE